MKSRLVLLGLVTVLILAGCVGRTGKVGRPISDYYQPQLAKLQMGETTPVELKQIFKRGTNAVPLSIKEAHMEGTNKIETWQIPKGGDIDVAALLIWGAVEYNKDQSLEFRFENDKLVSYQSLVIPDPPTTPTVPARSPKSIETSP